MSGKVHEHPKGSKIKIRKKEYRSGGNSFGSGWQVDISPKITGKKRDQSTFRTLEEAKSYAQRLWTNRQIAGRGLQDLSEKEIAEIMLLVPKVRKAGYNLQEVIEFALPRMKPKGGKKLLSEAVSELLELKQRDVDAGDLSQITLNDFKKRTNYILMHFGDPYLSDLDRSGLIGFFTSLTSSNRNRSNILNTFKHVLGFAKDEGYINLNELAALTESEKRKCVGRNPNKVADICILPYEKVEAFLNQLLELPEGRQLFPLYVLKLFCGVRADEAPFLTWDDINFDAPNGPEVSICARFAKGRRIRQVPIPENAMKWLSLADRSLPLQLQSKKGDRKWEHKRRAIYIKLGIIEHYKDDKGKQRTKSHAKRNWERHTFASHHYELHGNEILTSRIIGHTQGRTDVLFNHYRKDVRTGEGKKYFDIVPKPREQKVVNMPKIA